MWENYLKATGGDGRPRAGPDDRPAARPPSSTGCDATGCSFQPALAGTLHLARTNAWFLGGGKAHGERATTAAPSAWAWRSATRPRWSGWTCATARVSQRSRCARASAR
ncbi:MAG: hypothetical protein MZV70_65195 [Desulfobacterales bacterium]|nr:hypothetical protein [Desulfobacterales bacterium]